VWRCLRNTTLAVSVELRLVTDKRTDGRKDTRRKLARVIKMHEKRKKHWRHSMPNDAQCLIDRKSHRQWNRLSDIKDPSVATKFTQVKNWHVNNLLSVIGMKQKQISKPSILRDSGVMALN